MAVVDPNFWGVNHPVAMVQPAVAQFAVLTRGTGKGRVKAAYLMELGRRQRHVIRGKEACLVGIRIIVVVKVIDEDLAGH